MEPETMTNTNNEELFYQLNMYFGIIYPADLNNMVMEAVAKDKRYAGLASDHREAKCGKSALLANSNSDVEPTLKTIIIDDMTISGDEYTVATEVELTFEPSELLKLEKQYSASVLFVTELYNNVRKELVRAKVSKEQLEEFKLGWHSINCTWQGDESSSGSKSGKDKGSKDSKNGKSKK